MKNNVNVGPSDVFDVACWFIERAKADKKTITHKKLQKLLYYAKHWSLYEGDGRSGNHLKLPKDESIFNEKFEAWVHGAVCRKVFNVYRRYGFQDLTQQNIEIRVDRIQNDNFINLLEEVWNIYGDCDADELEALNHQDTPWINQRINLDVKTLSEREIDEDDMRQYEPMKPKMLRLR